MNTTALPPADNPDGSAQFDTKLWTGDGNSGRDITGYSFSPGFAWIKSRSNTEGHSLNDIVRGANKSLASESTSAENTQANKLTAFNSDGFELGNSGRVNYSNYTYVGWAWNAGSSNTSISAGSLNSSVYNSSENWVSTGSTTGTAYNSTYTFSNLFDSDLTGLGPQSNSTTTQYVYTFANALSATANTIIFYSTDNTANVPSANTGGFFINGTQVTTSNCTRLNNSSPYKYRMDGLTTLSSIGSQQKGNMTGIEVNGKLLVDTNAHTIPNVPLIASTVRANPTAGFSIVSWTGNSGIRQTIGHGLNAAPEMIIAKKRDSSVRWAVYHKGEGPGNTLVLNSSGMPTGGTGVWGNKYPTSSVFYVSNDAETNANSADYIGYCFAPVEGYSAMGTYTGNGNADGPLVPLTFRPAFILTKGITDAEDWYIRDTARSPFNEVDESLRPNDTGSEYSGRKIDILSNGFKIRDADSQINENGKMYLYYAVAENPFQANGGLAR